MDEFDYLIVGGGIAGTTAAETIRKRDPDGSIAVVSGEPHRLYSRILLSKPQVYRGEYDASRLFLKTEDWYHQNRITLISGRRAVSYDPHKHAVGLGDGEQLIYGKLLLALGTTPHAYEPGGALPGEVLQLQTIDDALELRKRLTQPTTRVLVVGKGFVSFETAWIAHEMGAEVTVLNRNAYPFFGTITPAQGAQIRKAIVGQGALYRHEAEIRQLVGDPGRRRAILNNQEELPYDVLVAGVGVSTPSGWLHRIDRTSDGAVLVNARLATNVPSVWAAGDGSVLRDTEMRCGNWAQATAMGRTAGENMVCDPDQQNTFTHVPVFTTQGFGQTLAFVGNVRTQGETEVEDEQVSEEASVRRIKRAGSTIGAIILNRPQLVGELMSEIERTK